MKLIHTLTFAAIASLLVACAGGEAPPSSFPGLTLDGDSAYLASNLHIHKFDPNTGRELWRYPAVGQTFAANDVHGPFAGEPLRFKDWVITAGTVGATGIPDAHVYALDDKTGVLAWRWSVPGTTEQERREFADGAVTDGRLIFVSNGNGTLYALDPAALENGVPQLAWKFATGNKLWSRPLVVDGRVYQSSLDHTLYALDAATGSELWRFKAGASVASTPSIADGVLYFGAFDGHFYAVDAATGQEKWKSPVDAWVWTRATIVGDAVYALGANGDLACLSLADGRVRWAGNVLANSGATNITWGISESPLVDGGRVIVTPGGPGGTMVAVDAKSGRLVWRAAVPGDPAAGYASIIVVETGGLRQYVNFVHSGVIGVRADSGQWLWGNDASANGTANCSSPVVWRGHVFSASGYGKGGALVRLAGDRRGVAATLAYTTKDMKSHHGGLVVDGDHVYGTDDSLLTCLDLRTGRVAWQHRSVGKGAVVWADGLLVLRGEEGPVVLVECSPRGYVERGRFTPAQRSDRPAWPHPVIANGKLWLRDQETLAVYDLRR